MPSLLTKFLLIYKALLQYQFFQEALQNLSIPQQLSLHQNTRSSAIFFLDSSYSMILFVSICFCYFNFFLHECLFPWSFSFLTSSQSLNPVGCTSKDISNQSTSLHFSRPFSGSGHHHCISLLGGLSTSGPAPLVHSPPWGQKTLT